MNKPTNRLRCYLCQELNSHTTKNCPLNKCKTCGEKRHKSTHCRQPELKDQFDKPQLNKFTNNGDDKNIIAQKSSIQNSNLSEPPIKKTRLDLALQEVKTEQNSIPTIINQKVETVATPSPSLQQKLINQESNSNEYTSLDQGLQEVSSTNKM